MKISLDADRHAPARARSFVAEQLASVADLAASDVTVVVSELVTNAVRAGAHLVDVDVRLRSGRLDLRVCDDAPGWPTPRAAGIEDLDGRGLAIVEKLSDSWTADGRGAGKCITATWQRPGR